MADAALAIVAAMIVSAGGMITWFELRAVRRRRQRYTAQQPRRLREQLYRTEDYIRQVNQATSDAELDSLEDSRNRRGDTIK